MTLSDHQLPNIKILCVSLFLMFTLFAMPSVYSSELTTVSTIQQFGTQVGSWKLTPWQIELSPELSWKQVQSNRGSFLQNAPAPGTFHSTWGMHQHVDLTQATEADFTMRYRFPWSLYSELRVNLYEADGSSSPTYDSVGNELFVQRAATRGFETLTVDLKQHLGKKAIIEILLTKPAGVHATEPGLFIHSAGVVQQNTMVAEVPIEQPTVSTDAKTQDREQADSRFLAFDSASPRTSGLIGERFSTEEIVLNQINDQDEPELQTDSMTCTGTRCSDPKVVAEHFPFYRLDLKPKQIETKDLQRIEQTVLQPIPSRQARTTSRTMARSSSEDGPVPVALHIHSNGVVGYPLPMQIPARAEYEEQERLAWMASTRELPPVYTGSVSFSGTSSQSALNTQSFQNEDPESILRAPRLLQFSAGWSLVRFPILADIFGEQAIADYVAANMPGVQSIWACDPCTEEGGNWIRWPAMEGVETLTKLEANTGYWIDSDTPHTLFGFVLPYIRYSIPHCWSIQTTPAPITPSRLFAGQTSATRVIRVWQYDEPWWSFWSSDQEDQNQHLAEGNRVISELKADEAFFVQFNDPTQSCPADDNGERLEFSVIHSQVIAEAVAYRLALQQNSNGSWGPNHGARAVVTSTVVDGLLANGLEGPTYFGGIAWLENHHTTNFDTKARRIRSLAPYGSVNAQDLEILVQAISPAHVPKAYGLTSTFQPSALDTAIVLKTIQKLPDEAPYSDLKTHEETIKNNLLAMQLSDGGWGIHLQESKAFVTAMAVQALGPYVPSTEDPLAQNLNTAISKLETWWPSFASELEKLWLIRTQLSEPTNHQDGMHNLREHLDRVTQTTSFHDDYALGLLLQVIAQCREISESSEIIQNACVN